jgi:hypothetical protein
LKAIGITRVQLNETMKNTPLHRSRCSVLVGRVVILLLVALLATPLAARAQAGWVYEAGPVDLVVTRANGKITVEGFSVFQLPERFVWCGSPIRVGDQYHLFYSAWESGPTIPPFVNSWVIYSKIGVAVSDSPYGGFREVSLFLKGRKDQGDPSAWDAQMVHNPFIQRLGGTFFLYHGGSRDPGAGDPGSRGAKLSMRDRVRLNQIKDHSLLALKTVPARPRAARRLHLPGAIEKSGFF